MISSYPTYEEWKLIQGVDVFIVFYSVLILPMRNGNFYYTRKYFRTDGSSYPTYEEWKLQKYPILIDVGMLFLSYL